MTIAYGIDLFLVECLSKFELISLRDLMLEHINKVINKKGGRHRIPYGYFMNKLYDHIWAIGLKGSVRTLKQKFRLITFVEKECIKGKIWVVSQVLKLLDAQGNINKEIKEMNIKLSLKNTEIAHLEIQN